MSKLVAPRPTRLYPKLLAALGLLGVLGAVGVRYGLGAPHAATGVPTARLDGSKTVELAVVWPIGIEREYQLSYQTRVASKAGAPILDMSLKGPLRVVPALLGNKLTLCIHFDGTVDQFSAGATTGAPANGPSAAAPSVEETFAKAIHTPFFAVYEANGNLSSIKAPADGPPIVHQLWRFFAASIQVSHPAEGATEWTAEEQDSVGSYTAQYRLHDATIDRQKLRYTSSQGKGSTYTIGQATAEFRRDPTRALLQFSSRDDLTIDGIAPLPSFETRTRIELRKTGQDKQADLDELRRAAERLPSIDPNEKSADAQREIDRARIGGFQLPDTLTQLAHSREQELAGTLTAEDRERRGRAYIALTAMLRTRPTDIVPIKAQIENGTSIGDVLVDALRDAGSKEAQHALADLAESKQTPRERRLGIVRALSGVAAPTRETVDTLRDLEKDPNVGMQAKYGLGADAHRLQKTDPGLADEVRDHLLAELAGAGSDVDKCTYLTALGNAGAPEALSAIAPFLSQSSAHVRACAAQGVRRIPGPEVDALLVRLLADETEDVRWNALDAMSERTPTDQLTTGLAHEVTAEPVTRVRTLAVQTAARWVTSRPELAAALAITAERDSLEDLRRIARNATTPKKK